MAFHVEIDADVHVDLIGADADLAAVATHCGYTDQSHLNRDFLGLAATTPGELRDDPLWAADFPGTSTVPAAWSGACPAARRRTIRYVAAPHR